MDHVLVINCERTEKFYHGHETRNLIEKRETQHFCIKSVVDWEKSIENHENALRRWQNLFRRKSQRSKIS